MINYIPIKKDAIPFRQSIQIENETFGFEFHYNEVGNFFTVDLYRGEELLAAGAKLVYGSPLFLAYADERFPKAVLIPFDFAGQEEFVNFNNLGEAVFLYIITQEELQNALSAQD